MAAPIQGPKAVGPATPVPLSTQMPQPAMPQNEESLVESFGYVKGTAVFKKMSEDVKNLKEAVSYAKDQNFPSFGQAFHQAFGNLDVDSTMVMLEKIDAFLNIVSGNPKFAETMAAMLKKSPKPRL